MPQLNLARIVLDQAKSEPDKAREALSILHQRGETVSDILQFVREVNAQKIKVPSPGWHVFGVSGFPIPGLTTALSVNLAEKFCLAVPSPVTSLADFSLAKSPTEVTAQLTENNLSFFDLAEFHPGMKPLVNATASLDCPTILQLIEPFINPAPLIAQVTGVSSLEVGDKLAEAALQLGQKICCLYDTANATPGASIHGATKFWMVGLHDQAIHTGVFFPEDYGIETVKTAFPDEVEAIPPAAALLAETAPTTYQATLTINQRVTTEFFNHFQ